MGAELEMMAERMRAVRNEIARVVIGQEAVVQSALVALLSGQHLLIEGVPGVAKTLLVRTFARVLGGDFGRIQFTPDLMPSDITGTYVFDLKGGQFTLHRGPVFTTFLLADEINRAPAKTQAALLQAMQERRVTLDRETHELNPHFTVFATQNPLEYEGTYPLPEAQKDRFMLKVRMSPPDERQEAELARRMLGEETPEALLDRGAINRVMSLEEIAGLRATLRQVAVRDELLDYIVRTVRATREDEAILSGAGPRATQAVLLGSRALAALDGRDYVTPDDVKSIALPAIEHRIVLRPEYEVEGMTANEVVRRVLEEVPVPR